jgi:hypothetical protein
MERWDRTKLEYLFADFLKEYDELKEENQKLKDENDQLEEKLNTSSELADTIDELETVVKGAKESLAKLIFDIAIHKKMHLLVIRDELEEIKRGLDLC